MTATVYRATVQTTGGPYSDSDKRRAFGFHLMLDCYNCAPEKLDDISACYGFLDNLVVEIGAEKQTQPYIFRTPERFREKRGLSGWVPVVESGISIHTLTDTRFVSLDVYSCHEFDHDRIISFTDEFFGPSDIDVTFALRGRRHS